MYPYGMKSGSKKARGVSLTSNGPRLSKKKRKLLNENSDPDVLDLSSKYWHGLQIDASDDIKEKLLKHLSSPSRRYKLKTEGLVLPAKKKRKLQKNGSLETDSDDEKNSKKCKAKKKCEESPSSKLRKWKTELASLSGTKSKSKKSGELVGKGKKSGRQKLLSSNYEDHDGVGLHELGTSPELKNKARKKKLLSEKSKGANHLMKKKKVKVGKGVLTGPALGKKKKSKLRVNKANFMLLSKKQQNKMQKKFSLQLISDDDDDDDDDDGGTDSDHTREKSISTSSLKKNLAKLSKTNWMDINKKKLKKHLQELEIPKSKKSKQHRVYDDDDDDEEEEEDNYEEEEEEDFSSVQDVSDDLEEEEDDDDDDDESSEDRMSDDKSGFVLGLSNGDWDKVNEKDQIQQVTHDDDDDDEEEEDDDDDDDVATYGNGWKTHEGEKKQPSSSSSSSSTSSSTSLLHPWAQNNGVSTHNTYHHESIISQQPHQLMQAGNMASGCLSAQTLSHPMTNNTATTLPQFGAVEEATSQQHYPTQIQDSSSTPTLQQHFADHQQQRSSTYNLYSGVDYGSQPPPSAAASYNNDGKSTTPQSQNFHLQQHLLQSQTHSYSGFNHLQSQQNNSSAASVQKVKHYYPAPIGKEGILEVEGALQPAPPEEVLTQGFRISIKRCDMATLVGSNWLNDEIINFYMNLIVQRGKTDGYSSVYIPSTFFFPMVMKRGYSGVRRWTKNVDIFEHDLMLIPIHLEMENHWTLIAVDFHQFSICYYDSYLQDKDEAMDAILDYLKEEMKAKKQIEMDTNCWAKVNMKNIPLQENLSDCGVFSCIYAEYISRGAQMDFTQEDMPYFRRKMVYEILHQNILNHSPRDTDNLISDDILEDGRPCVTELSNLAGGPVTLPYGLADSLQSPKANENTMKVINEGSGLTPNSKDEEMSKDSDALESSSCAEEKMTNVQEEEENYEEDEETRKKRYSTEILSEIKQIVNVFEDANTKEQKLLLGHLRCILEAHSKKKGKNKSVRQNLKELLLMSQRNSETEESEAVTSNNGSISETSSSSIESTSTEASGSNDEESKSSDQAESSSQPDLLNQLKLNHVIWEVEKLMVSITDMVRSIGKVCGLMSSNDRLLDPSGSLSVIKGIEFISSELKNISNHYNQMVTTTQTPPSPRHHQTTAVKKHVIVSSPNAVKKREANILQYIASQLSVRHKNFPKFKNRKQFRSSKKKKTKRNVIPKKLLANENEGFCNENRLDRGLLAHLIKDVGGRLLEERPSMPKFSFKKRLLNKLPLSDEISELICPPTFEKGHKHQAHKNLLRSDQGKKGKKKK